MHRCYKSVYVYDCDVAMRPYSESFYGPIDIWSSDACLASSTNSLFSAIAIERASSAVQRRATPHSETALENLLNESFTTRSHSRVVFGDNNYNY